jgi:hypothetical protein
MQSDSSVSASSVTLCGIVQNEAPYLLEWIAWYKLLGVPRIVIYDNESTDGSTAILSALHHAGEIVLRTWPNQPGQQPQIPAYCHAIEHCSTEWITFLDIDEFLILHHHAGLRDLLQSMPTECSAIAFNQRFFGSSGLRHEDDRLVIERFVRTSVPGHPLNRWIKSAVRVSRIKRVRNPHGCELSSGTYTDPSGRPCVVEEECRAAAIALGVAQYNHYILKSHEEFLRKRARGRGTVAAGDPLKSAKYSDAFFATHDQNQIVDDSAARKAAQVRQECDRLRALCHG